MCTKLWHEHQKIDPNFMLHPEIQQTQRRWLREAISSRDALVLIAEVDGQIVGTGTATVNKSSIFWPEWFGYIRDVYVEKEYRQKGIGKAITEQLINWLRDKGVDWIELVALAKNAAANKFWREQGFVSSFNVYRKKLDIRGTSQIEID